MEASATFEMDGTINWMADIYDGSGMAGPAAFDFAGVILSDKCADPLSPKCVQSAAGTVLSQRPGAGAPLPADSRVALTVSSGWTVPDFIGSTLG